MKFNDGFFNEYDVPDHVVPEFEFRKKALSVLRLIIQIVVALIGIVAAYLNSP